MGSPVIENVKKYKINKFVYHEHPTGIIVQNARGITKITENRLVKLVKQWESTQQQHLTNEEVYSVFKEETDELLSFLQLYNIISEDKASLFNFSISNTYFYTNHHEMKKKFLAYKEAHQGDMKIEAIDDELLKSKPFGNEDLVVVFLNPYNKKFAKEIRDIFQINKKAKLLMTYTYNDAFYMDSLYSYNWGNPCHICHIENIEAQLRINTTGNNTYQNIIDSLYSELETFNVSFPLNYGQLITIYSKIINFIDKIVRLENSNIVFPEEYHQSLVLDLNNFAEMKDIAFHWELCDCYE
ncbi:McbB family protein [Rossellomorea sp. AcN35-11]|nr:McbB family protein [Rossellomorea aquimaris]WJV29885.1 McbB family protein [Rossellomorea sp. AcN35-11]